MSKIFQSCSTCGFWISIDSESKSHFCPDCGTKSTHSKIKSIPITIPKNRTPRQRSSALPIKTKFFASFFSIIAAGLVLLCIILCLMDFVKIQSTLIQRIYGILLLILFIGVRILVKKLILINKTRRKNPNRFLRWFYLGFEYGLLILITEIFSLERSWIPVVFFSILAKIMLKKAVNFYTDNNYTPPPKPEVCTEIGSQRTLKHIENEIKQKRKRLVVDIANLKTNVTMVRTQVSSEVNKAKALKMLQKAIEAAYLTSFKYLVKWFEIQLYRLQNTYLYIVQSQQDSPIHIHELLDLHTELEQKIGGLQEKIKSAKHDFLVQFPVGKPSETIFGEIESKVNTFEAHQAQIKDVLLMKKSYLLVHSISNFTPIEDSIQEEILHSDVFIAMDNFSETLNEIENEYARFEAEEEVMNEYQ